MKYRRITRVLIAMAMIAVLLMTGCGKKEATLESYINENEEVKSSLDEAIGGAGQEGLTVDIQGNDIVYNYDLSAIEGFTEEQASDEAVKEALEKGMQDHAEDFKSVGSEISANTEIKGIRVVVNYNYKGEVVATSTFEVDGE